MGNMGKALMGSGVAAGENRAVEAAEKAVSSPLLDDATVDGARGILINVTGGEDMTMLEVNEAAMLIQKSTHDDANIIFGSVINDNMEGQMRVTVIATGFESKAETEQPVQKLEKKMPDTMEAEPMRKAVGDDGYRHLRGLAHEIKEDNPDSLNSSTNFDIPTFLRKHAD